MKKALTVLAEAGEHTISFASEASRIAATAVAVARISLNARSWSRPVRTVFMRQLYFSGVQATRLVSLLSVLCGVALVSQVQLWLANIGQRELTGQVLVRLLGSGIGPIIVGFIIIGRSGTAICAELAGMRHRGEIHVLEGQGVDTFSYLVMPRAAALSISSLSLSILFIAGALFTGWLTAILTGLTETTFKQFSDTLLLALTPSVILDFTIKSLLCGLLTGAICCVEGLATGGLSTEIPQAVTKGVVLCIATLLITSVIVSVLFYV